MELKLASISNCCGDSVYQAARFVDAVTDKRRFIVVFCQSMEHKWEMKDEVMTAVAIPLSSIDKTDNRSIPTSGKIVVGMVCKQC